MRKRCTLRVVDFGLGYRQKVEMGMAARSARAQAKIVPVPAYFTGVPVYVSTAVKEGEVLYGHDVGIDGGLGRRVAFVAPLTFWRLQHPGREPLLSRHCRGLRELERDRRRYPRPVVGA